MSTFNSKMSRPRYEYRWKIETAYHQRTDKRPSLKGEWVTSKAECYKDFFKKIDKLDGNQLAYLYKRVNLPEHFLVFGKTQYHQYKYKIKAAFYREEPLWTMYESKWGTRLGKTLSEFKKFRKAGYSYVDCCDPIEYLYMRKSFPIENLPPLDAKSIVVPVKEIEHEPMDQGVIDVKEREEEKEGKEKEMKKRKVEEVGQM